MMRGFPLAVLGLALTTAACTVGPKYVKPSVPAPAFYREELPANFKEQDWKVGEPNDQLTKGKWWEIFKDSELNTLEEQVNVSNQTVATAEAQFREARAVVQAARAGLYPTVSGSTSIIGQRSSAARPGGGTGFSLGAFADIPLAGSISWVPDLWGQIHKTVEAGVASAQLSAAQLENARLSLQAELALDYFQLRGLDGEKQLLDTTVSGYQRALDLTQNRFNQGVASQIDVVQAQTQLETTRAQATDTQVQRAQFEHAIAILIGKPPSELTLSAAAIGGQPPAIPGVVPSQLLERRPDVASAERQVASANAQIGIAKAAFYPTVTLSASAGFEGTSLLNWLTWPSRFFSLGPALAQTLFDGGRRRAVTAEAEAAYDTTVANYRQSVLTAFQQVEDDLAALRILDQESQEQSAAVTAAERSLALALTQYQGGVTAYLQVITAQAAALQNESTAVQLLTRRMTGSVDLIQALGGGWNISDLPTPEQIVAKPALNAGANPAKPSL
jgi:NodT family efflux transporter outer membrane factor (OMF) lipoprotein